MATSATTLDLKQWADVLERLRAHVPPKSFDTWFAHARPRAFTGTRLELGVPTRFIKNTLVSQGGVELLAATVADVTGHTPEIDLFIDGELFREMHRAAAEIMADVPADDRASPEPAPALPPAPCLPPATHPKFRFDTFVAGPREQLALAAARAAAARPGEYSVLMLYGDTGTGKTHLLQAIAHEAHRSMPSRRVIVTDARRFVQEFSAAHLAHDLDRFRRRYAEADILAVDDFHVLAEGQKNASAAEFLTIFDHFAHDGPGRQIVLASSRAIENLEGLPEGLRNRLQAGLTVHLAFPDDPDAAVRLIRAKAGARGVSVPREAARIIAEGTPPNARALEGAVGRLCALTQLEGLPMGAQTARLALDAASGQADGRALTLDDVARAVSDASRVSLEDLRGRGRTRSVRMARQLAATLARRLTRASLAEMGRYFDNRTHATVLSLLRGAKPGWWKDRVMGHMTEQALRLLGRREPVPDLFPEQGELPFPEP